MRVRRDDGRPAVPRSGPSVRSAVAAAVLLSAVSPPVAADFADVVQGRARMSALVSGLDQSVEDRGPFNPGNMIAFLPDKAKDAELRVDLQLNARECDALFKPRLRWTEAEVNDFTSSDSTWFFNTALLKCRLGDAFDASIGRQSLQWGNGQFRSPSNPFFAENVRFNPAQEILGKDFVVLSYQPSLTWRGSYIGHVGDSYLDTASREFERANALKLDWTGEAIIAGAIVSKREGAPVRIGGYTTLTWSEATLFYGEASVSQDAEGAVPVSVGGTVVGMAPATLVDEQRRYSVLAGTAYTFEGGTTLYAEYLHTTESFTDDQARDWLELARGATSALGGIAAEQATAQLFAALDPGWRQLRNDYLFLQLARTEYKNKADLALRAVANLDDEGSMISGSATVNLGERAQWFAYATRNFGGPETEFGRMQRYAIQMGFRFYAF